MELTLLNNTGTFAAQLFTSGETILKAKVKLEKRHTSIIRGNLACEEYLKKLFPGQTERSLCIHIKRNPNYPDDWRKCIVRVHGCLWEDLKLLWLEGLKIKLHLGFCIADDRGRGMRIYPPILCAEMLIPRANHTSPFPIDPVNEACLEGGNFAEVKDVAFYHRALLNSEFGANPLIYVMEVVTLIADEDPQQTGSTSGEGTSGGEITPLADTEERALMRINRKILDSKIHCDVVIAAKDGSEFNCNKNFLAAHSPVFASMLEADMKEAKTNRIEMQDMTKNGVRALLDFIYTFEVDQAFENGEIALELLQAGYVYDIKSLEKQISFILLVKDVEFFTMNMALGLFIFARKVDSMKDITSKAAAVLMAKPKEFLDSACFKKMRQENPALYSDALEELFFLSNSK